MGFGIAAYALWGAAPIYWHLFDGIDAIEILAHRTVWGLLTFVAIDLVMGAMPAVMAALRDRRARRVLALSGALLACNWGIFIYAVSTRRVLHASLGYFVNPLLSVLLGMIALGERPRRLQWIAIALASAGVAQIAIHAGGIPWIALALAASFGVYGLLRKIAPVEALAGSTVETVFMAPLGAAYLAYLAVTGGGALGHTDLSIHLLLLTTGVVTALPLVWFTAAARRLPLSTVGFLQYLAPTCQFLSAVILFGEPFAARDLAAFGCIWAGLVMFSIDLWRQRSRP